MKLFSITLILIALLGLLAYTNPQLNNYDQFISQRITEETRKEKDPMAGMLGSLFGGLAADLMTKQTVRNDYVFFSTYDTAFGNEHIRAIGVLNNFYITEDPEFKRSK
jgi:energy-converting hydrogenase Eha subunit F